MMLGDQSFPRTFRALRILIVEDYADGRATLCALLQLLGHQVETAEDGVRGVEKALAFRPEVALIDLGLPRLNGYQVAERLRAALGRQVLLIACTAYNQAEDRQRAVAAGFDAYLVKPLEMEELDYWLGVAPGGSQW